MRRSLRFWTRFTWENTYVELGLAALIALAVSLGMDQFQVEAVAAVVPYYLFLAAAVVIILVNTSMQVLYIPLLLSFGETRRRVFLGFQYFRVLVIAVAAVLSALIWLLIPGEVSRMGLESLPTLLTLLVVSSSVGSLLGTLHTKCRWASTVVLMVIFGLLGGGVGVAVSNGINMGIVTTVDLAGYLTDLPWWLAAAALVLLALDETFHWLALRRQQVKL